MDESNIAVAMPDNNDDNDGSDNRNISDTPVTVDDPIMASVNDYGSDASNKENSDNIAQSTSSYNSSGKDDHLKDASSKSHRNLLKRTFLATVLCGVISLSPLYYVNHCSKNNYGKDTVSFSKSMVYSKTDSDTMMPRDNIICKDDLRSQETSLAANLIRNAPSIYSDHSSLSDIISSYAKVDSKFKDNKYYRNLREHEAFSQIRSYGINSGKVIVVNKTFQKAMVISLEKRLYLYSTDSLESFRRQGRDVEIFCNDTNYIAESSYEPKVIFETDCSTGRNPGDKRKKDDMKTPDGKFKIYGSQDSHDWLYEGKKAYGPKFFRIQNSIGMHGNGTDTISDDNQKKDRTYQQPESLGIYANNFGHGRSHGCVRFDNNVLRDMDSKGLIYKGMDIIIFEDKALTSILSRYYGGEK